MKKTSLINKMKIGCVAVAIVGLAAVSARADYVLGSWQNDVNDGGWIDHHSNLPLYYGSATTSYSLVSGVVSGFANSLQINQNGYAQSLELDLGANGEVGAFLANTELSFQWSVPPSTSTSGYSQLYQFFLKAPGYGYQNLSWSGGNGYSWTFTDVLGPADDNLSG